MVEKKVNPQTRTLQAGSFIHCTTTSAQLDWGTFILYNFICMSWKVAKLMLYMIFTMTQIVTQTWVNN